MFNKSKYVISVILLLVLSIVTTGCTSSGSSERDLSTPSTRLVGHWGYYDPGFSGLHLIELYFGEVDEEGFGSCVAWFKPPVANLEEDWIIYGNYHIISENGNNVTYGCFEGDEVGVNVFHKGTIEVTEDGQFLKGWVNPLIDQFQYIDSKTKPSPTDIPPTDLPSPETVPTEEVPAESPTAEPTEAVPTEEVPAESPTAEPTRDFSTPLTRLIGHWGVFVESEEGDELSLEMYFGEVDDDGVGSVVVRLFRDATVYHQYRVLSESGDTVTLSMFDPNTEVLWRTDTIDIAPDGLSITIGEGEYQYVDAKTEP